MERNEHKTPSHCDHRPKDKSHKCCTIKSYSYISLLANFCDNKFQDWQDTAGMKKNVYRNLLNIIPLSRTMQFLSQYYFSARPCHWTIAYMTTIETSNISSHIPSPHTHFVTVQKLKFPVFYLTTQKDIYIYARSEYIRIFLASLTVPC